MRTNSIVSKARFPLLFPAFLMLAGAGEVGCSSEGVEVMGDGDGDGDADTNGDGDSDGDSESEAKTPGDSDTNGDSEDDTNGDSEDDINGDSDDDTSGDGDGDGDGDDNVTTIECPDDMCSVPAGSFAMGCDGIDCPSEGQPVHEVNLKAFKIDKYEVTVGQYLACLESGTCSADASVRDTCVEILKDTEPQYPTFCAFWETAQDYCSANGKRLPTEAEWEYAARGPQALTYPWGEMAPSCEYGNFSLQGVGAGCGTDDLAKVGSFPAGMSPFGVMDMIGNVQEFVSDWYDEDYYSVSPSENPTGPASSPTDLRSARGGTFKSQEHKLKASERGTALGQLYVGFRCVQSD